jgi:hypothetical protein
VSATADLILEDAITTPREARCKVLRQHLSRGYVFQVVAEWYDHGNPPAEGQPDQRAYHCDYYDASTPELAKGIVGKALEILNAGGVPDLRDIAAELKRRDQSLAAVVREAEGAHVMGDTAPDERPNNG